MVKEPSSPALPTVCRTDWTFCHIAASVFCFVRSPYDLRQCWSTCSLTIPSCLAHLHETTSERVKVPAEMPATLHLHSNSRPTRPLVTLLTRSSFPPVRSFREVFFDLFPVLDS